jgi:glucose dehydrogenase
MQYLYELDAGTGKPVPAFGENGRIDLRKGLGGINGNEYRRQSIVLTSPGVIYKNLIIVGGRDPESSPAPPGDIRAFNVRTGGLVWDLRTIPHPGEPGYETWPLNAWKTAGAANNWGGMTIDQDRGVVYIPTGSAVPDFYGGARIGDDRWANCLLAVEAATGKILWSFQGVHHDLWDRDFPAPPALLRVRRDGKMVDAIAQTTKQGFVFVLDRDTGKPLFPIEERAVKQSTVPGELSSKTEPFPALPAPYARQTVTINDLTNRTPEAHADALKQFRELISGDQQFYPLSVGKQTIAAPGFDGGGEYGGGGVDRETGVLYVNANDVIDTGGLEPNDPNAGLGLAAYDNQCALCHRDDRRGSPPEFPSLVDASEKLTSQEMAELVHSGKGRMPSFPNIQGSQLEALLEYVRTGRDSSSRGGDKKKKTPEDTELRPGQPITDHYLFESARAANPVGALVYQKQCAICHGDEWEGVTPGFPSLLGLQDRMTNSEVATLVRTGKGRMPAFDGRRLPDPEVENLLRFLGVREKQEPEPEISEMNRYHFTGYHKFRDLDGYPAVSTPWGTLSAIDLNTGKYLWKVPFGTYPELAAHGMTKTGTENYGGPVVTAGGLVIICATVFDRKIHIYDSRTGKLLWEYVMPYSSVATPATYSVNGKQYIVVGAGGSKLTHGAKGGVYIAFSLP